MQHFEGTNPKWNISISLLDHPNKTILSPKYPCYAWNTVFTYIYLPAHYLKHQNGILNSFISNFTQLWCNHTVDELPPSETPDTNCSNDIYLIGMGLVLFEVPAIIRNESWIRSPDSRSSAMENGISIGENSPANGGSSDVEWVGWTDFGDERWGE